MSTDRPAKRRVRDLWVEVVRERKRHTPQEVPFYLTMPGADARDILLLIDRGILEVTESGAIAETANPQVVAVERNSLAVAEIQRRLPGLKVIESDVLDVLHVSNPINFPAGSQRRWFRATVINLDFNGALVYRERSFPVLEAIAKLATLHASPPRIDWTLLLTVHGDIPWSQEAQEDARHFIAEHCALHAPLDQSCQALIGKDLHEQLLADDPMDLRELSITQQQLVLMVFVPVRIAWQAHIMGWRITIAQNLRYGGEPSTAPMVTWVIHFASDPRASATPQTVLKDGLDTVLRNAGYISGDGKLVKLL